jgi:hypothetical protein
LQARCFHFFHPRRFLFCLSLLFFIFWLGFLGVFGPLCGLKLLVYEALRY